MSDPVVLLSTGDVVGPAGGVTDNSMVLFSGTSGKIIKGNNAVVTAAGLALLDDVNAAAQRATLGLGTAATANVTTSATDTTAGRLMKVGDFGLGLPTGIVNPDSLVTLGMFQCAAGTGTLPAGFANGTVLNLVRNVSPARLSQILQDDSSGRMWARGSGGDATLDEWQEIALTDSPAFTGIPTAPTASAGTSTTQVATTAFVAAAAADSKTPTGAVLPFAMNTPPTGWLKANGAAISRTTYATLFAAIGTVFGVGDGSTTFNVPDMRGEFFRGWDDSRGVDPGRQFGSWQADEFKSHGGHTTSQAKDATSGSQDTNANGVITLGGSETRPRNIALLTCIKY